MLITWPLIGAGAFLPQGHENFSLSSFVFEIFFLLSMFYVEIYEWIVVERKLSLKYKQNNTIQYNTNMYIYTEGP